MGLRSLLGVAARHRQTLWALLFACALVSVSYVYAQRPKTHLDAAVVVADKPRVAHDVRDSDGDGMYDWEEGIRGTDPHSPNERPTDTPHQDDNTSLESTTGRFSVNFLGDYLARTADGPLSDTEKEELVRSAIDDAAKNAKDVLYSRGDIQIVTTDDAEAIRTYGNTIGRIMTKEQVPEDNELFILQRALQTDSPETLEALDPLIAAYKGMIEGVKGTAVPTPLINEHLALLNALLAIHNDIVAMRNIFEDGLPGAVRVQRYEMDVDTLYNALVGIQEQLELRGSSYDASEPGSFFEIFRTQ